MYLCKKDFAMATCVLTILSGTGGTVTPASGIKTVGTPITLTATPTSGYDFLSWALSGGATTTNAVLAVTPSVDATYTASFVLHDLTSDDYTAINAFMAQYYSAAGISGSTPNAAKANRMLPNVIALSIELRMFDLAKSLSLNTALHYAIIAQILSDFYPVVIPIV